MMASSDYINEKYYEKNLERLIEFVKTPIKNIPSKANSICFLLFIIHVIEKQGFLMSFLGSDFEEICVD